MPFTDPLTPDDLYWIGYLQADGCLIERSYSCIVSFAQRQQEPVEAYRQYVKAPRQVRMVDRQSNFGRNQLYQVSCAVAGWNLKKLGLKKQLRSDIYESPHFWRGLCDGDGTVTRVKNYGIMYPVIAWSGNEYDMSLLADWLQKTFNWDLKPKVGICRSIFRVALNGRKAVQVIKYLYQAQFSALTYKRKMAEDIIQNG